VTLKAEHQAALDSSVGFAGGAPAGAAMAANKANVGVSTVAGGWAYQGSRAAYHRGLILNAQGDALNSLSEKDGRTLWKARVRGSKIDGGQQVFSPPALGARNMYLCTTLGQLLAVDQRSGKVQFQYDTKQPMAFQPALAHGNVYAGTANGMLVCLKTGQNDADGWTAWGGNAQHNKKD
jgi:outer membrane protein assembly factor BamB